MNNITNLKQSQALDELAKKVEIACPDSLHKSQGGSRSFSEAL